jgi:hypothetical protein
MPVLRSPRPPNGAARLQAITGWDYLQAGLHALTHPGEITNLHMSRS